LQHSRIGQCKPSRCGCVFEIRRRIRCSGARSTLSEQIDSINKRRRQIQLAADAAWSAGSGQRMTTFVAGIITYRRCSPQLPGCFGYN
jgi:hypothetical protein